MRYVFQFARILVFCFLGEMLHVLLPLPIPASVYGLLLLFLSLKPSPRFRLLRQALLKPVLPGI